MHQGNISSLITFCKQGHIFDAFWKSFLLTLIALANSYERHCTFDLKLTPSLRYPGLHHHIKLLHCPFDMGRIVKILESL